MAFSPVALQVNGSAFKPFSSPSFHQLKTSLSSTFKPFYKELQKLPMKMNLPKTMIKNISVRMLETFVDSMFEFVDQPWLPSQSNFAPVEEIGEAVEVTWIEGKIPTDFPEGVYVRNGSNNLFGGLQSAVSVFGRSNQVWVEGEGMLHALYFEKDSDGKWSIFYKNKFVETESYKKERQRDKPTFLPTVEGDSLAVSAAILLNMMRYGLPTKNYQNINAFVHSGKLYTTTDNYPALEIDMHTLESLDNWDFNGAWKGPFTSHPKVAPGSGELVTMGVDGQKPYCVIGVVSVDGRKLLHKVDIGFNRGVLSHEIGVTQNYNVIIDHPLVLDLTRIIKGDQLLKYDSKGKSRIGVMPRYGDKNSIKWFEVEPNCTFHLVNCFEDGDEVVVVRGCRASTSIIPGPDWGEDKFEWFSRGFNFSKFTEYDADDSEENGYLFHQVHEWRLNMATGTVDEKSLTGTEFSMDFPFINGAFTGLKHKYGYTQVIDSLASSTSGVTKFGRLAKLCFEEGQRSTVPEGEKTCGGQIKVEYHKLEENVFCTGAAFVPKSGGDEEDDGFIVTHVHNEMSNVSQVLIIDAKKFESQPIATINLPNRVPYGFHGIFISMPPEQA
ncbi:carotenoid 9,10(9',10')-cleavage dioxygenase 1 [Manihot esculenta]|uniref:Uncharacterized protein n=1 Tax=Manihot esculenta TaxID=3983 RepID=A0A2C9W4W4_MANES|nr:carotenoid 9,10(9',10')-cleavage dioxygenase 1 [Manihot esculenta]OAY54225.1 hypothetical protein MANES_03G057900v8 [Manihot esculenta]